MSARRPATKRAPSFRWVVSLMAFERRLDAGLPRLGVQHTRSMAVLGHKSLTEAERYTREADQALLATKAMTKLEGRTTNRTAQTDPVGLGNSPKEQRGIEPEQKGDGGPGEDSEPPTSGYERAALTGIINKYWHFRAGSATNVRVWLRRSIGYLLVGPGPVLSYFG